VAYLGLAAEGERVSWRRSKRTIAPFAGAAITVALVAAIAGAHDADITDPNDTAGKLDIQEVRVAHETGKPRWAIVTFGEWGTKQIWDRGYIIVMLDTRRGVAPEHYLLVRSTGATLVASLWRIRSVGPDSFLGPAPVKRWSPRNATVQVALSRLEFGASRSFYRWWAETLFTSDFCRRTCHDRAPNVDAVLQWRPGMSPSPSPSPSGSPSP
jgi:hypothetical protein